MSEYGVVTAPDTVRIERTLPGPIERLWAYLTEPDKRALWLAGGEMDVHEGGRVALVFRNSMLTGRYEKPPAKFAKHEEGSFEGRITACEPPRLLAYTWGKCSEVRFELTPQGNKVHLVLTHQRLPSRDDMVNVSGGWHAHLGLLADRLEGRTPATFWPTVERLHAEYEQRL